MYTYALKGTIAYTPEREHFLIRENTYLVCENGKVAGTYDKLPPHLAGIEVHDFGNAFIIPGMCDIHVHASQSPFQGIGQNIENGKWNTWFDRYAFPDEAKFRDPAYAKAAYTDFVKKLQTTPTTRVCAYATSDIEATHILMDILNEYGFAGYVGNVSMDRNCNPELLRSTEETLHETRIWLEKCKNGVGAVYPIITPRYFPTCTEVSLAGLGKLAQEFQVPVQSHLSESRDEIAWVKSIDPTLAYYAQAYERHGLLNGIPCSIMAHCVFSSKAEQEALKRNHVLVAHCPQSNLNSSGMTAPVLQYLDEGIEVGLGTDVGGGNTLNLFKTIFEAVLSTKIDRANGMAEQKKRILSLPGAFYLATKGGGILWKSGSFEKDYCFDAVVIDDSRIKDRNQRTVYERLERIISLSDDRDIVRKYINGREVYRKGA